MHITTLLHDLQDREARPGFALVAACVLPPLMQFAVLALASCSPHPEPPRCNPSAASISSSLH